MMIDNLLSAILLPRKLAIVKREAHSNNTDDVPRGNARADLAAKAVAKSSDV